VLAGDYNVVPTDEDIYNPRSWLKDALLQPESRERYQRLLAQGWTDSVRARYQNERIYTFWDYFRQHWQKNSGLRIDHLLLNAELAPRLRSAGVDRWVRDRPHASYHAPTWIELDMGAKEKGAKRQRSTVKRSNTQSGKLGPIAGEPWTRPVFAGSEIVDRLESPIRLNQSPCAPPIALSLMVIARFEAE
jgi:hypothetical protein